MTHGKKTAALHLHDESGFSQGTSGVYRPHDLLTPAHSAKQRLRGNPAVVLCFAGMVSAPTDKPTPSNLLKSSTDKMIITRPVSASQKSWTPGLSLPEQLQGTQ